MSMVLKVALVVATASVLPQASAGDLTVVLGRSEGVSLVGAVARWDADGKALREVDPKARIDQPQVTDKAVPGPGTRWTFRGLPEGTYDLILLTQNRVRVEGFHYPPVLDFDKPLSPTADCPEDAREAILADIAQSRHYENKVQPLFLGGDDRQVRVFVQLVRDQATSYDAEYGAPVATARHEVWQYTHKRGVWTKERRTRVLDRILMPRADFARWTWVWEPALGGIKVGREPVTVRYEVPASFDKERARGWIPEPGPPPSGPGNTPRK